MKNHSLEIIPLGTFTEAQECDIVVKCPICGCPEMTPLMLTVQYGFETDLCVYTAACDACYLVSTFGYNVVRSQDDASAVNAPPPVGFVVPNKGLDSTASVPS